MFLSVGNQPPTGLDKPVFFIGRAKVKGCGVVEDKGKKRIADGGEDLG